MGIRRARMAALPKVLPFVALLCGLCAAAPRGEAGSVCRSNSQCSSKKCLGNAHGLLKGKCSQLDKSVAVGGVCSINRECSSGVCAGNKFGFARGIIARGKCTALRGSLQADAECARDEECS